MKRPIRYISLFLLFIVVFLASSCGKSAENEHLPEYCQTYSSFTSFASRDFYDLLIEQDIEIDKRHYLDAIAAISLEFVVDNPNEDIDLSGIQCFQNLTDISLTGQSFRDLSPISALSNIQSIELVGTSVVSIDSFKNLSKIKSLVISDTYTLQSVDGVEEMTKLTNLDLSNNGIVNIEGLNNLINLTTLYLNDNDIIEFPSINQLDQLETLNISNNNISILGDDLSGLTALRFLYAQNNDICDISALDDLIRLEVLNLGENDLGCLGVSPNFDSLENAPFLRELHLDNNGLTSISGLEGRDINLETLFLNDNELTDITPIAEYTDIVELHIENNNIENIDDLSDMTGLTTIDLSRNIITDFSDLLSITNLEEVNLSYNEISVIPDISTAWPDLTYLDLSSNELTDTSGVMGHPSLETLNIMNNGLVELKGLSNLPYLDTLIVFDDELVEDIPEDLLNPNRIRIIRDSFTNVPELLLHEENVFDFGFEVEDHLEIYNSINGLTAIATIQLSGIEIDVIDELSLNLPNLVSLDLSNNNIEDIRFILGSPELIQINISGNPVSNLEVFSGLATSDLDNLVDIDASNVTADNNLLDSFIDLPSIERINLTGTSVVSINNSFNDLPTLLLLSIDGDSLTSIVDSFNDIFETYNSTNEFDFSSGRIGHISGSFNNGYYHLMNFESQNTILPTTTISGSFNNLIIEDPAGINLFDGDYESIVDSFNGIETSVLSINESNVSTITGSFVESSIETLDLSDNYIETIASMNQITSVKTLLLNNNVLTTVSFLDGFPDLETLNISNQYTKDTIVATLVSLDGVNNMPSLTTFSYANIGITEINGLKNLGITEFSKTFLENSSIAITSVIDGSFTDTNLTVLNLNGHAITDVAFLSSLDVLTTLNIGLDISDLSGFQTQDFETTLTSLSVQNIQEIADFSYLSAYDDVVSLTIESPLTTINNLDGLDSLTTLVMDYTGVTTISGSFNNMLAFDEDSNFILDEFNVLTAISSSFDMYGTLNHEDTVHLEPYITVTDSFNNLVNLSMDSNNNELTPSFDTLSFDNIEAITLEYSDYSSHVFLNGYTSLTTLTIANLDVDITDLSNDNITYVRIINADSLVDSITVDLNSASTLELTSFRNGLITINSDTSSLDITASNATLDITVDNTTLLLEVDANDVTLNSANLTAITLDNYESTTTIFNTDILATISRNTTTEVNASTFTVNSTEVTVDYDTRVTQLVINNNFATTINAVASGGTLVINNTQTDLLMDVDANQLVVSYNTLEQITISGTVGTIDITSTNFDTLSSTADITVLNVDSGVAALSVSGTNTTTAYLTNNSINDITIDLPGATTTLYSTNNQALTASIITNTFHFEAHSIPSITVSNASNVTNMDLLNNNSLSSLSYGTATLTNIDIDTNETTFSIVGTTGQVTLTGALFTNLNVAAADVDLTVLSSAATLAADLTLDTVLFDNTNLSTLNLAGTSDIRVLSIDNTSLLSTVNTNNAPISLLSIDSGSGSLSIDATNTTNTVITGGAYTSLTVDTGTNDLSITSSNTGTLAVDFTSDTAVISGNYSTLNIDAGSSVSSLDISSSFLGTFNASTATIASLDIQNSSVNLDVSGTEITDVNITDALSTLDLLLSPTTTVTIDSPTGVAITTDTNTLHLISNGNSSLSSSILSNLEFNLGANDLALTLDKIGLNVTLDGTASKVTLNGTNIGVITTTLNTNIETLDLQFLNVNTLDFTTGVVNNLDMSTTLATITIEGDEVQNIDLNGVNLSNVTVNSSNVNADLTIVSTNGLLDLNGSILNQTTIDNDNLTSLDITGFTTDDLTLLTNDLATLTTGTSVTGNLSITNNQLAFTLSGSFSTLDFTGNSLGDLAITSSTVTAITTTIDSLNLTVSSPTIDITATNLSSIEGTVSSMILGNTDSALSIDVVASGDITLNNNTATSVTLTNATTAGVLSVDSTSITTLSTNDATLTTLQYGGENNNVTITTKCDDVDLSSSGTGIITLNYLDVSALTVDGTTLPELVLTAPSSTVMNLSGSMGDVLVDSNNLVTLNVLPSSTIATLDIDSTSMTSLDTNDATITTLDYLGDDTNITFTTVADSITMESTGTGIVTLNYEGSTALSITATSLLNLNIDVSNGASLSIEGTITNLDVQSTSLNILDTNNTNITTFAYTGNNSDITITTESDEIDLTSTGTGIITLNYEGSTSLEVTSNTVPELLLDVENATSATILGSVTDLTMTSDSLTSLLFDNAVTITNLDVTSSTITTLNTSSGSITSVVLNGNNNNITLSTRATEIDLNMSGTGVITLNYNNTLPAQINVVDGTEVTVNAPNTTTLTLLGSLDDMIVTGNGLTTITTTSLFVDVSFTMNDTLISDLDFVSTDMLTVVVEITMNTLSNTNMDSIVSKLSGTTVTLTSPIVNTDVYDYHYSEEYTRLEDQEAIDTARYNQFRTEAINDAWAVIVANQYMDHLDETFTKNNEIDTQTYQSLDDYYNSYLTNDGIDEGTLTQGEIDAIKASIQSVLDDSSLTFTTNDTDTLVTTSIEDDADTFATNEVASKTYTLS